MVLFNTSPEDEKSWPLEFSVKRTIIRIDKLVGFIFLISDIEFLYYT